MKNNELLSYLLAHANSNCLVLCHDGTQHVISVDLIMDCNFKQLHQWKLILKSLDNLSLSASIDLLKEVRGEAFTEGLSSEDVIEQALLLVLSDMKNHLPVDFLRELGYITPYKGHNMIELGYAITKNAI